LDIVGEIRLERLERQDELRSRLAAELSSLGKRRDLLASFIRHAKIPLRL
jgi:hypothetical protein